MEPADSALSKELIRPQLVNAIMARKAAMQNKAFHRVLDTSAQMQHVAMHIEPRQMAEREIHPYSSQFFTVVTGRGIATVDTPAGVETVRLQPDVTFIVPANTYHELRNDSYTKPLKLLTIYAPPLYDYDFVEPDNPSQLSLSC